MNVVARTIDEKRCEERFGFSESLSLSLSLSASGTPRNEGRQVHRGCSWETAACTIVAAQTLRRPLLSSSCASTPPVPRGEERGGGQSAKTKRQIAGKKYRFSLLSLESNLLVFRNFALLDFQEPLTLATVEYKTVTCK